MFRLKIIFYFIIRPGLPSTYPSLMPFKNDKFDYIITVCNNAKDLCPVFPGKYQSIHWDIEDPVLAGGTEEEQHAMFREIREELEYLIRGFLKSKTDI